MSAFTRDEIDEFWQSWLEVNREAERRGDWKIMADHYAEDATYGWMYTPDEHFMAVGREEIRELAIGQEMGASRAGTTTTRRPWSTRRPA